MKILLTVILLSIYQCGLSQANPQKNLKRAQGYLLTQTSFNSETANHEAIYYDKVLFYRFIPLDVFNDSPFGFIQDIETIKDSVLYVPMGLNESQLNLDLTNYSIENNCNNGNTRVSVLPETESFKKTPKTLFRVINDRIEKRAYEIVYIDGLWEGVSVPYDWVEAFPIGRYLKNVLMPFSKRDYVFYFLKKVYVIAYDLKLSDEEIEVLTNN